MVFSPGSFQSESDLSEFMASEVDKGLASSQGTPRSRTSKTPVRRPRGVECGDGSCRFVGGKGKTGKPVGSLGRLGILRCFKI